MNLTKLWNWFYTSSEDPTKTSATAQGVLIVLASLMAQFLSGHGVATTDAGTTEWISQIGAGIGAVIALFGAFRKATNGIDNQIPPTV